MLRQTPSVDWYSVCGVRNLFSHYYIIDQANKPRCRDTTQSTFFLSIATRTLRSERQQLVQSLHSDPSNLDFKTNGYSNTESNINNTLSHAICRSVSAFRGRHCNDRKSYLKPGTRQARYGDATGWWSRDGAHIRARDLMCMVVSAVCRTTCELTVISESGVL